MNYWNEIWFHRWKAKPSCGHRKFHVYYVWHSRTSSPIYICPLSFYWLLVCRLLIVCFSIIHLYIALSNIISFSCCYVCKENIHWCPRKLLSSWSYLISGLGITIQPKENYLYASTNIHRACNSIQLQSTHFWNYKTLTIKYLIVPHANSLLNNRNINFN